MRRKVAVLYSMILPVAFLTWASLARAQDERAQDDKHKQTRLLGSWTATVTPTAVSVCGGPAIPVPPPFTELLMFSGGGGFQETNSALNWNVKTFSPAFWPAPAMDLGPGNGTDRKHM
jgi:hypothetical protein